MPRSPLSRVASAGRTLRTTALYGSRSRITSAPVRSFPSSTRDFLPKPSSALPPSPPRPKIACINSCSTAVAGASSSRAAIARRSSWPQRWTDTTSCPSCAAMCWKRWTGVAPKSDPMPKPRPRTKSKPTIIADRAPPSALLRVVVLGWSAASLGALLICRALGVPLGQGSFIYRFSELQAIRGRNAAPFLPIAALALWAVWLLGAARRAPRATRTRGLIVLFIATAALAAWVWAAPPRAMTQHMFNLMSPSHEGAFMIEVDDMQRAGQPIGEYLRGFDRHIQKSATELLGTRVISNPPGVTVLFHAVTSLFPPQMDPPGWIER